MGLFEPRQPNIPQPRSSKVMNHPFRTVAAFCAVIACFASPMASAGTELKNGSFESNLDDWTSGGNVTVLSGLPYQPTDGSRLAVFNATNSAPNGFVSQQIPVRNDINRQHRLRLDVGNLGFASIEMRMRVQVTEELFGVTHTRVDEIVAVPGITGGATRWQEASFHFPSPASGTVRIILSDVSTDTNSADLVVDHLSVDDAAILTVEASENPWLAGNEITLSPASIEGNTSGSPSFQTNHDPGTIVTLTAPAHHNLKSFLRWRKNGVDYDTNRTTSITMDADSLIVAVYDPPLTAVIDPPAEARGFMGTGPFSAITWSGHITNRSGTVESWSATAEMPDGSPHAPFFTVTPSHGTLEHGGTSAIRIFLNKEVFNLHAGTHYGRVEVASRYSTVTMGVTLRIIDPNQHLENGGFESGFDGWTPLNHVTLETSLPYVPAEGQKLVAFNSLNSTPNGTITRTFPTEAGVTYALYYHMGALAYNTHQQDLRVDIANDTDPASPPFQIENNFVNGIGGGNCHWEPRLVHFVAQGESTRITFTDVSTTTDAIDLLLDHVRVSNPNFDITVTTAADENDPAPGIGSGDSLREAIARAASVPGTNAIRFHPSLDGQTITLGGTQLAVTTDLAIDASGLAGGLSVSGNALSRVFRNEAKISMRNLCITGGNPAASDPTFPSGGGIFNTGSLMLDRCVISNNTAPDSGGAIRSWGELSLTRCRITENHSDSIGGGVFNQGQARLEEITVTGNSADSCGGGLACQGAFAGSWLVLDRSTISGNTSGACGGGYSGISGYKQFGNLHALNSTFAGNHSSRAGGAVYGNGPVNLLHCTLSSNSSLDSQPGAGGLTADSPLIENSIIAGNTPELPNPANAPSGGNFLGGNAMLKALGAHGGATHTMPPLVGSPVLDQATSAAWLPAIDQRGGNRSSGTGPDIGAVEVTQLVVNTLADENDGISQGGVSLRDAVAALNSQPVELIRFAPSLNGGTIVLNGSPITVITPSGVGIDASNLPAGLSVSGNHLSQIMRVIFSGSVTLDGLTLRDAAAGALLADWCSLDLRRMKFLDNHNSESGGALTVLSFDAFVRATDCLFAGNHSDADGGAVSNGGILHITNSTFSDNQSDGNGGALRSGTYRTGFVEVRNSTFSGNTSLGSGGAIHAGSIRLIHSTVTANSAGSGSGGGVFSEGVIGIENGAFNTINSIIAGNSAPDFSGVIQGQFGNNLIGGNPLLAPLADYGGATPTRPPLPGSPAIDGAPMLAETPSINQRGAIRPIGLLPDIGAVEAFPFSTLALMDSDNDGIDDRLEPAYELVVGVDDANKDSDGDGSPDGAEIANMTNPSDPNSLLRVLSLTPLPGDHRFRLRYTTFPGLSYTLECDQNLNFHGPGARVHPLGIAGSMIGEADIDLLPGKDFVRIRRDP
jgi:CSLREA domain-containing protein